MKKLFLSLVAVMALTVAVQAQDDIKAGSVSLEVQFLPANNVPIQLDYLRARYFLSDNMAVRVGLFLDRYSQSDQITWSPTIVEDINNSYLTFGLFPGIEMHMPVGDRLSPYFGAEVGFLMKTSGSDITNYSGAQGINFSSSGIWEDGTNHGYSSIVVNLVAGMDFYVYQGLFMGVELGFGLQTFGFSDVSSTVGATTVTNAVSAKESSFGFNTVNAIRLGWKF